MENKEQINHFLNVISDDIREVMSEKPTKASMIASMSFWLSTVNTIKGIIS
jgi:hypothetical protein